MAAKEDELVPYGNSVLAYDTMRAKGATATFRTLRQKLFLVATNLDSGASVTFGAPGHDHTAALDAELLADILRRVPQDDR